MVSRGLLFVFAASFILMSLRPLPAQSGQLRAAKLGVARSIVAGPGEGFANGGSSTVADDIAKIRSEWAKDLHSKQLDQIVALYAPEAVFLQPNGERVTSRAAIRDLCKKIMDTFTSDISLHSIVTEHSGDLAYDSGDFRESLVKLSDGTTSEVQGNYLMIFKRQSDGTWLIVEQMWTLVTPATE
jgi:ketosteroid isomerase-like protein